jgi:hypothetical protein
MTFDEWWKQFSEKWGKPKMPAQEKLSRTFAKTAWNAGYVEGFDEAAQMAAKLKQHKEGP